VTEALSVLQAPSVLVLVVGVLGLIVGSFLNVVIHRLPRMMEAEWAAECAGLTGNALPEDARLSLATPGSHCPACSTPIRALHNIPVLSWLALRGRCAACRAPISLRYPLVELGAAALGAFLAWRLGWGWALPAALVLAWSLLAASVIDFDTQLLPDRITLPLLWAGLLANVGGVFAPLEAAVVGAVAGYLALWLVYWAFKLATGKEGMGYGDFKLLAALGAWLGWQLLPVVVLVAACAGSVLGLASMVISGSGRDLRIPFGPFLAVGGLVALLWGHRLTAWWLGAPLL